MTTRTKSALLLGLTLLIGVVLGMVVNAWMAEGRFARVEYFRSERGFAQHLEDAIQPTDEAQRKAVREILDRSAARIAAHRDSSQARGRQIIDSTRTELAKVLTPEQLERLDEEMRMNGPGPHRPGMFRGRGFGRRGMGGSPPGLP